MSTATAAMSRSILDKTDSPSPWYSSQQSAPAFSQSNIGVAGGGEGQDQDNVDGQISCFIKTFVQGSNFSKNNQCEHRIQIHTDSFCMFLQINSEEFTKNSKYFPRQRQCFFFSNEAVK